MKIAEDILKNKGTSMVTVSEDTNIYDALETMTESKIGAVLVEKDGKITGIWTERDLMRNILSDNFDIKTAHIGDYMFTGVRTAQYNDDCYQLLDKFLGQRIRHLVIEKNRDSIGIISSGDVIRALMDDKVQELKDKNHEVSWDYYEDWKWEDSKTPPIVHNTEGLRLDLS